MMSQPAPLRSFDVDYFNWNKWTQSPGTSGQIRLELVDDFIGIRNMSIGSSRTN